MSALMPTSYDGVWTLFTAVAVALLVMALVRWFRSKDSGLVSLLHILVILFVPLIGPAAYLVATRPNPSPAASRAPSAQG